MALYRKAMAFAPGGLDAGEDSASQLTRLFAIITEERGWNLPVLEALGEVCCFRPCYPTLFIE